MGALAIFAAQIPRLTLRKSSPATAVKLGKQPPLQLFSSCIVSGLR